jgi:hydrogenase maturation protein HypF
MNLKGWVQNSVSGVRIEVEGPADAIQVFRLRMDKEKPSHSWIQECTPTWLEAAGYENFRIRTSISAGQVDGLGLPDLATCSACCGEMFDPANRRYLYPFTNCTNCGPRFTILEKLPYDRPNTSMKSFSMCPQCEVEYEDPCDRRFHAQPNACPACGPQLELWNAGGRVLSRAGDALRATVQAIRDGQIVAVKGIGGFHLITAADNDAVVQRLRRLKHREAKAFALLYPSLEAVRAECEVSPAEERLFRSREAPIVLLQRRANSQSKSRLSALIAPRNPNLGVMLPSNPLHHLLMFFLNQPVVATSGNLSEEPICTKEQEAVKRLRGIADFFLVHNRPIVRHMDDSIVRVMAGREMILRRARGYVPLPISMDADLANLDGAANAPLRPGVLAVGAHMKNAIALMAGPNAFLSQHIGDLDTPEAVAAFRRAIDDFQTLFTGQPQQIAADAHPDYFSTRFAKQNGRSMIGVQHHLAHVLSCMADNELKPPILGVAWDGTGYGLDGTIWGGEFFRVTDDDWTRVGSFRQFRLPGGDHAVKEPCRSALGLLHELFGPTGLARQDLAPIRQFSARALTVFERMLTRRVNSPLTSSVGRLFDAVASLLGLCHQASFEGQAAMELEFVAEGIETTELYPVDLLPITEPGNRSTVVVDWAPIVEAVLSDLRANVPTATIAARFHNGLIETIVKMADAVGEERIVLSGGCFQNRYLTERAVSRLREAGHQPFWHQRVPPNDGGIALGQVLAAWRESR